MTNLVVLRLYKNGNLVEVKQFDVDQIVIGKNEESQFSINDDSISPLHAVIDKTDAGYTISDLGSEKGIFQGDEKILNKSITSGDEIKIGDFVLQFFIGVPKAEPVKSEEKDTPPPITYKPKEKKASPKKAPKDQTENTNIGEQERVRDRRTKGPEGKDTKPAPESRQTFAPQSAVTDLKKIIKPEKGTVVEMVVAWKERVIDTLHFQDARSVTIGSDTSCDVIVPLLGTSLLKHEILRLDSLARAYVTTEMSGEYVEGGKGSKSFADLSRTDKMRRKGDKFEVDIQQGDMLVINLAGGTITIYIRYVSETPMPMMAPLLDLTASEVTGVILAIVVAAIFGLYMMVYAPEKLDDDKDKVEEPLRIATIKFNPPKPKKIVKVGAETKKKVVKVKNVKKKAPPSAKKKGKTGQAATLKKVKNQKKSKTFTGQKKKGGAVKTGKRGSNMKTKKPDPKNLGLLSVFGAKGTQKELNKASDGAGGLIGLADQATGNAGFQEDRPGANLGGRLKSTGAGGKGKSSVGISGNITSGRGSGAFGYGEGGIGKKGSVQINIGGQEEAFVGTIDKEAIRRVILDNISQVRHCYEKQLNKNPDLFGKLVLEWDIIDKGRVRNVVVKKNTLRNRPVATCISKRLSKWRFPEPPEDQIARVTFPFVFAAK